MLRRHDSLLNVELWSGCGKMKDPRSGKLVWRGCPEFWRSRLGSHMAMSSMLLWRDPEFRYECMAPALVEGRNPCCSDGCSAYCKAHQPWTHRILAHEMLYLQRLSKLCGRIQLHGKLRDMGFAHEKHVKVCKIVLEQSATERRSRHTTEVGGRTCARCLHYHVVRYTGTHARGQREQRPTEASTASERLRQAKEGSNVLFLPFLLVFRVCWRKNEKADKITRVGPT